MSALDTLRALVSSELKLTALLSRPRLSPSQVNKCLALIELVHLDTLKSQIDVHRIWPCAYQNIKEHLEDSFPITFKEELHQEYCRCSHQVLLQFKASNQVLRRFKENAIPAKIIKGIPLAQRLFGDIGKRYSKDIDILIPKEKLESAHALLKKQGFNNRQFELLSPQKKELLLRGCKDVSYSNHQGLELELHTRLCVERSAFSEQITEHMLNRQSCEKSSENSLLELLYYCWHGGHSLYHRLKWLLDVTLYLKEFKPSDTQLEELLEYARRFDLEEILIFSWVMTHLIYDHPLPRQIKSCYNTSSMQKYLIRTAIVALNQPENNLGIKHRIIIFLGELALIPSYKKKFRFVIQKLRPTNIDLYFMPKIPDKMLYLYYAFRPLRIIYNEFSKRRAR